MTYLLTLIFCVSFACDETEVVRRSYPTQAAAVKALKAHVQAPASQAPAAQPRLFRVTPQDDGTLLVRELTLGPAPDFRVRVSTYQATVPQ